jgi:hypothetical protein
MEYDSREFNQIELYRERLVGQVIKTVDYPTDTDEGLVIVCENGHTLYFGFSGCEGMIAVGVK